MDAIDRLITGFDSVLRELGGRTSLLPAFQP